MFLKPALKSVSIFLQGIASTEYRRLSEDHLQGYSSYSATGSLSLSVAAGRVSYTFGLRGPSVAVETACSSSLVSLHTAFNSIALGQCSVATNAGVNMLLVPGTTAMFQKAGMLATDGRCKTLSNAADGYARADACGATIAASPSVIGAGFTALAMLAGSAVNQDGRSSSLTAPNGPAQQDVIKHALKRADIMPRRISALQLHGTGTSLGDPIEVGAVASALAAGRGISGAVPVLMAAKSWLGHAEAGAGMVGLAFAQAALASHASLPILHLVGLNTYVTSALGSPYWSVKREAASMLPGDEGSLIGTSAFAFQGTNAHALLRGPPEGAAIDKPNAVWQHSRLWVAPLKHAALQIAAVLLPKSTPEVHLHCNVMTASLAYLWDHKVSGKVLLPGAALFELAAATGHILASRQIVEPLIVQNAAIPTPLILPAERMSGLQTVLLNVVVDIASNDVIVTSGQAGRHLRASYSVRASTAIAPLTQDDAQHQGAILPAELATGWTSCSITGNVIENTASAAKDVFVSPAVLDSCLQLGAIPALNGAVILKVPAGVDAVALPGSRGASGVALGSTALERSATPSGSLIDYGVHLPEGAAACLVVGLQAKPLLAVETSPKSVDKASLPRMEYSLTWLAVQVAEPMVNDGWAVAINLGNGAATLCSAAIETLQQIASSADREVRLQMTSFGAFTTDPEAPGKKPDRPPSGLLWGLMRSASQELATLNSSAVDLDILRQSSDNMSFTVNGTMSAAIDAYGCTVRSNVVRRNTLQAGMQSAGRIQGKAVFSGSVVITGGHGSIGSLAAAWLNFVPALENLVLVGRSGRAAADSIAIPPMLATFSTPLTLVMGDAACREDAARLYAGAAISSFIHSGGVLADGMLAKQTTSSVRKVFAPKVVALALSKLHLVSHPIANSTLFSSVAALLGSAGQINYSAANSLLDTMAQDSQEAGIPTVSVQWGAWAGVGMASHDRSTALRVERLGMGLVQPEQGLGLLHRNLLHLSVPVVAGVPFFWDKFIPKMGPPVPPIFQQFVTSWGASNQGASTSPSGEVLASRLLRKKKSSGTNQPLVQGRSQDELRRHILGEISGIASRILDKSISATEPLMSAGLDSLSSIEFRNSLESKLGLQLPSTLVFDYPNLESIALFVASQQKPAAPVRPTRDEAVSETTDSSQLQTEVAAVAKSILGHDIQASTPLMAAGMDSLSSVEFKNSLETKLGLQLPSTLVFDYPSTGAISLFIAEKLRPVSTGLVAVPVDSDLQLIMTEIAATLRTVIRVQVPNDGSLEEAGVVDAAAARFLRALGAKLGVELPQDLLEHCINIETLAEYLITTPLDTRPGGAQAHTSISVASDPEAVVALSQTSIHPRADFAKVVSVVGMAARLPGSALLGGDATPIDACDCIPADRWEIDAHGHLTGGLAVRFAGLVNNVDIFDASSFGMTDSEAALMDPQQRLVLESVAEVLAQPSTYPSKSCGIFVGCSSADYAKLSVPCTGITAYTGTGTSSSVISGRVSYTFGLRGPALTIDTACSSSLAGIHMAYNTLFLGQSIFAAGSGANLLLHPETLAILQKAGMLTQDGRCKTLSTSADGYVRADAVGTLLLQTGAVKVVDCIAVVGGSAVNQDGRSSSLTAPNGPAQQDVIRDALSLAGLGTEDMSALQLHGTGTALGDPIEVGAASAVFMRAERRAPLVLFASKSWMGHAEPAAGIAGLSHAQFAMNRNIQLPLLHLRRMNEYVSAAMEVQPTGWAAPRQTAIFPGPAAFGTSAFAFQGTNAHVILQNIDSITAGAPAKTNDLLEKLPFSRHRLWLCPEPHRWVVPIQYGSEKSLSQLVNHNIKNIAPFRAAGFSEMCAGCH